MVKPENSYLICTLPRSGSWLLADILERTTIAGRPREFFEPAAFKAEPGTGDATRALAGVVEKGTTSNGVFGAKLHWHQFEFAGRVIRAEYPDLPTNTPRAIEAVFPNPRYIWLTRHDKSLQAISYYRAILTKVWWRLEGDRRKAVPDPKFSFAAIHALENYLLRLETNWQRYFEGNEIAPLVIVYEHLKESVDENVRCVLDYLGLPASAAAGIRAELLPQSDETTRLWTERYLTLKEARQARIYTFVTEVSKDPAKTDRASKRDSTQKEPVNNTLIRVASPQRSGHHAVINWIAGQSAGSILYLNDAAPDSNPFLTSTILSRLDQPGTPQVDRNKVGVFTRRDLLLVSYEDRELQRVFDPEGDRNMASWVGDSGRIYNVIVLRDVFNTFASRLRASWMRHKITEPRGRAATIALWKGYAREVVGRTQYLNQNYLFVNYNLWFSDEAYRRTLAESLGLRFTDAGRNIISGRYGGSSFDGMALRDSAETMRVLDRWKEFGDSDEYWALFEDNELVELNNLIFGEIAVSRSPLVQSMPAAEVVPSDPPSVGNGGGLDASRQVP